MLKLIIMELQKLFHKKSIYIMLFLMLIFCLLNNILYYLDYDEEGFYKRDSSVSKTEVKELENTLKKYNINNESDKTMYITIKSKIDTLTLRNSFSKNTWQYNKAEEYFYDLYYQKNLYTYLLHSEEELNKIKKELNDKELNFKNNNWSVFINQERKKLEEEKNKLIKLQKESKDSLEKENLQIELDDINNKLKIISYRQKNNVKEEKTYLNVALEEWYKNKKIINNLKNKTTKSKEEKLTLESSISTLKINEYILKHKQNINKENSLNYELRTIAEDYEIFIIILILIISSTILSEEFTKGTIKLLLIKPYSRGKILLSKYLSCLIILIFSIIFLIVIQLIIGGYLFKFDSLKLPVVIYHFGHKKIIEYSIWTYMILRIIAKLPFYILLLTISYALSTWTSNTVVSITIPILYYLFDNPIKELCIKYQFKITKYLLNINWHFENYLFGRKQDISNINLKFSLIICICYYVIILVTTLYYFKRKNIKNI